MSQTLSSKGFKLTLGSLATLIGLLLAASPYLNLVARVDTQELQIQTLKSKTDIDHDLLIRMSADIQYIKDDVNERKRQNPR